MLLLGAVMLLVCCECQKLQLQHCESCKRMLNPPQWLQLQLQELQAWCCP
jgi:hypothetical protein